MTTYCVRLRKKDLGRWVHAYTKRVVADSKDEAAAKAVAIGKSCGDIVRASKVMTEAEWNRGA